METALHDPSTGLHDIKPLEGFSPFPTEILWFFGILLLALLLYLLKRALPKQTHELKPEPCTPFELFQAQVEELETSLDTASSSTRELSASLSMSLRSFLQSSFQLPACEMTTNEIASQLDYSLRHALPIVPSASRESIAGDCIRVLKKCEKFSFQAQRFASQNQDLSDLFQATRKVVNELQSFLAKEIERTRSVASEHSSSPSNSNKAELLGGRNAF